MEGDLEGGLRGGGGYWWWWCKAVTEIEGDGVAAAGCSVHCQSGMINEWRPQLSLTFGEPHRTSAELSALWQGQSWTTNYFAITKVGCQLNPSHSLRQGQANFSFTYTHTHTLSRPWSCMDTQTHTSEQTGTHVQEHMPMWTCTQSGLLHSLSHTLAYSHTGMRSGQNRVNPSTAGSGNPMQVTYIKESGASRGGLMMTKQGW